MAPPNDEEVKNEVRSILAELSEKERTLLSQVIDAERDRIHMKNPRGIYDELRDAVKKVFK